MTSALDPLLVPFDGSEYSHFAAAHARILAARTGVRTVLATALARGTTPIEPNTQRYEAAIREATAALAEEGRKFSTPVETRLLDGPPAETLASEAERLHASVVVMGTRGRTAAEGILLGSTARYLLRACTRPVMVVHRSVPDIRTVIVGVDEGTSTEVVATAHRLADALGASVTLVTAVDADRDLVARPQQYGIPAEVWSEAVIAHRAAVFGPLRPVAGPQADELVAFGNAVDEIRRVATERHAELVVVGRKGRSGRDVDAWFSVAFSLAIRGPFATLIV